MSSSTVPGFTVGAAAALLGVSVRTLHHYDEIDLAPPSARTAAGYRQYSTADLDRLRAVLVYRELGLGLDQIAEVMTMTEPAGVVATLERQRRLLNDRISRLRRMVAALDTELEAHRMGIRLTPRDKAKLFGDFDPDAHEDEARERWGETDAYAQSRDRTSTYTVDDWARVKADQAAIEQRLVVLCAAGDPAGSEAAMDLAEEHRLHISRSFYDCSYEVHAGLADMYVADQRFTAHYESLAPGLASYLAAAIQANAARHP